MNMHHLKAVLVLCLTLTGSSLTFAAPLNANRVAGDAVWFAHVDLDQFKQTMTGQYLFGLLGASPEFQQRLTAFQAISNFDPRSSLRGWTLYSRGALPQNAVLLLDGTFDVNHLVSLLEKAKEYQAAPHGAVVIHSWIDELKPNKSRTYVAFHPNGLAVVGQELARVGEALDVIDGTQPSLAKTQLFTSPGPSASSAFLLAGARRSDLPQLVPHAAILKNVKTFSLAASETTGILTIESLMDADNEEAARQILAVKQGLLAFLSLKAEELKADKTVAAASKLIQGVSIAQKDARVTSSFKCQISDLAQVVASVSADMKDLIGLIRASMPKPAIKP